jgi:hypothetical protein
MTAPKVVNLARMTTSTTGTGTLTLGSAVSGFLSFADAGVSDGDVITYAITDGAASEIGRGTYTASGTTLARTTVLASTNSNSAINLSGSAQVMVTMAAEDINSVYLPDTDDSHTLELVAGSDLTDDRVLTITTGDAARALTINGDATLPAGTALVAGTENQTISGGATVTSKSITAGSFTVDCGDRPLQYITNSGAFTITAPAADGQCTLLMTNDGSAGAVTFSGFQVGSNTGDALTTTNGDDFAIYITRINSIAFYTIQALQ